MYKRQVKTRVPGTWGEEARYVWLRKENIMEIHGGKTMLTLSLIHISQLGNKELKKAAVTVAEGVREYSTGKRGR